MQLLCFAHRGEASQFLKRLAFKTIESPISGLYQFDEHLLLLITGEGSQSVSETLSATAALFQGRINSIINIGVAGSLDSQLSLGSIYSIRTAYCEQSYQQSAFKSFTSADDNTHVDCISSFERILDSERIDFLRCFASVVDKELWAVGSVAKRFKIPFYGIKIISDLPQNNVHCETIRSFSDKFSCELFDYWYSHFNSEKLIKHQQAPVKFILPKEFYATVQQLKQLEKIVEKSNNQTKEQHALSTIISPEMLNAIIEREKNPKKRTTLLLDLLKNNLHPFRAKVKQRLDQLLAPSLNHKINIKFSGGFENDSLTIQATIDNKEDLELLKQELAHLPYQQIQSLLNGELSDL